MLKVTHIITGLNQGGAEKNLLYLIREMKKMGGFEINIISFFKEGYLEKEFADIGVPTIYLRMTKKNGLLKFLELIKLFKNQQPDVVQTWMYHANLLGGIAAKLVGVKKIFWSIRVWNPHLRLTTKIISKLSALLSKKIPTKIIHCGQGVMTEHVKQGYAQNISQVIYNGFDITNFKPCSVNEHIAARQALGLDESTIVLGTVARFYKQKRFDILLQAFGILIKNNPHLMLVLCGRDVNEENVQLRQWINDANVRSKVILLGPISEPQKVYHALDVFVLSSAAEGFCNVLGEAMACGVPSVVTDVGDNANMLAGTGNIVVSPNNVAAFVEGIQEMLNKSVEERKVLGIQAREKVQENYTLQKMVNAYITCYKV